MGDSKKPKEEPKVKIPPAPPKPQSMLVIQESADYISTLKVTEEFIKRSEKKSKDK